MYRLHETDAVECQSLEFAMVHEISPEFWIRLGQMLNRYETETKWDRLWRYIVTGKYCYVVLAGGFVATLLVPGISLGRGWWWKELLVLSTAVVLIVIPQWLMERSLMARVRSMLDSH